MRGRLALAQAERDAGPRWGESIRRQHPAVRVEQDQRPAGELRFHPACHVRAKMRRPQERRSGARPCFPTPSAL